MAPKKITAGNKLISEFMGWEFIYESYNEDPEFDLYYWKNKHTGESYTYGEGRLLSGPDCEIRFNDSWDMLMPVCKKIIDMYGAKREKIFKALHDVDLQQTFAACVEFIEFWNDPSQEKLKFRCDEHCTYSRSMHQKYPRLCLKCGYPELNRKS